MNDPLGKAGLLYIVATPIGNLADMTHRAVEVLNNADIILAEDTRHSQYLLQHYGIKTSRDTLRSCHEHNEDKRINEVLAFLEEGKQVALISDAGTPLISDPGFQLVKAVRARGFDVSPIPGASSIIAALSVAGLPTDSFVYDGFLPSKSSARQKQLKNYISQTRTIVLLESSHRIVASLKDIAEVLGSARQIVVARELTKKFETILEGNVADVLERVSNDKDQTRGEFVVLIAGAPAMPEEESKQLEVLTVLLEELPVKQAAALTAKLTNQRKNDVYKLALSIKDS